MSDQQHDKRLKNRIPLQLLVSYSLEGCTVDNFTYNLSIGGMFIETKAPLEIGSTIDLKFELPTSSLEIDIIGEVIWLRKESAPQGMGIEFQNLTDEKYKMLADILEGLKDVG